MVISLEQGADLHMSQLMPLLLTVSCFGKIQIGFTFLVLAHLGSPGKRAITRVCMCVRVCARALILSDEHPVFIQNCSNVGQLSGETVITEKEWSLFEPSEFILFGCSLTEGIWCILLNV